MTYTDKHVIAYFNQHIYHDELVWNRYETTIETIDQIDPDFGALDDSLNVGGDREFWDLHLDNSCHTHVFRKVIDKYIPGILGSWSDAELDSLL